MKSITNAVEIIGTVEDQTHLVLDEPIHVTNKKKVRVIILPLDETDFNEKEWLKAAYNNPALNFLKEKEEDIYSINDGKKFGG
ncbi:MAG: hypothetical protein ACUZ8H_01090 [Candidatus Anammoxibacter sp.]